MLKKFGLLMIASCLFASQEDRLAQRIQSHLLIHDYSHAIDEAKQAIKQFPNNDKLQSLYIQTLAKGGHSHRALQLWKQMSNNIDLKDHRQFSLIESLAWGVLADFRDGSEIMQFYSLLGAHFTQDARAVEFLLYQMRSTNAFLRAQAIKLATHYRDFALQQEIVKLLNTDKNWYVRLEAINAAGQMGITQAKEDLTNVLLSPRYSSEEKAGAIQSLVTMYEQISEEELTILLSSSRSYLRQLAAYLLIHLEDVEKLPLILPLLKDPSPYVRMSTLMAIALVGDYSDSNIYIQIAPMLEDTSPTAALLAAWVYKDYDALQSIQTVQKWLDNGYDDIKRFAASLLPKFGDKGLQLAINHFETSDDIYVKANLAHGLIKRETYLDKSYEFLADFVMKTDIQLMFDEKYGPMFGFINKSSVKHVPYIPRYPQMIDQISRITIINTLTISGYSQGKQLIRQYLKNQIWGISSGAMAIILEEGDLKSYDIVYELLDDEEESIALQAALVLAFSSKDPKAIKYLKSKYANVGWDIKLHILEAVGFVGMQDSIPFLFKVLDEPFQLMRIASATALIHCLYH